MRLVTSGLIFLAVLLGGYAEADTLGGQNRTRHYTIKSKVLGEKRQIYVRTPPAFDSRRSYPVVYVLDGEWNFEFVASYLDYMSDNGVYPDLIVTGVTNTNRNRDYVPAPDPHHPHTGEASRFREFVSNEWIPFISKKYAVTDDRVLIGHSFGGVFTLHTLFNQPELFRAYIALGSSAWVGDNVLSGEAEAFFDRHPSADQFVYMAVGEGDGGPTVPSSKRLAALFELRAPASLDWTFSVTPEADHFKNFTRGLDEAFMALFPAWGFAQQLATVAAGKGAAGVNGWFADKESTLGFRFRPAWFDLGVAAMGLSREPDNVDAALAVMDNLRRHHPDNAFVLSFSASVFGAAGDTAEAISALQRAITIARKQKLDPNAIQISALERQLAGLEKTPEQDPE